VEFINGSIKVILTKIVCSEAEKKENPGKFCGQHSDLILAPD